METQTSHSPRLPAIPLKRSGSASPLSTNSSTIASLHGSDRPVFTSISTHGDDRVLKSQIAQYRQLAQSKSVSLTRMAKYFDTKPRGLYTDQPASYERTWQIARSLTNNNKKLVSINNPAWNVAQGSWNDPQMITQYENESIRGEWRSDGRPGSQAMRAHVRRASLDKRTFRSQPFVYHTLQPKDRFDLGIDGRLWKVEQERQRLERMDAADRPSEFFFHGHVYHEPAMNHCESPLNH